MAQLHWSFCYQCAQKQGRPHLDHARRPALLQRLDNCLSRLFGHCLHTLTQPVTFESVSFVRPFSRGSITVVLQGHYVKRLRHRTLDLDYNPWTQLISYEAIQTFPKEHRATRIGQNGNRR